MTEKTVLLESKIDPSSNLYQDGFECRYVQREDGARVIIYLSSHKGCDRACRMCHLTQTGQTDMTPATIEDFVAQAHAALKMGEKRHTGQMANVVHFNFMSRGEPLLNPTIRTNFDELADQLARAVKDYSYLDNIEGVKFLVSTILSGMYERDEHGGVIGGLSDLPFKRHKPDIYYSLYSLKPDFRKRWLPKAENAKEMLRILSNYIFRGGKVVIHGAFILGENDEIEDVEPMARMIVGYGIPRFNIVRFNPPEGSRYRESDDDQLDLIKQVLESAGLRVQMVDRVGTDIYASCGQFYNATSDV